MRPPTADGTLPAPAPHGAAAVALERARRAPARGTTIQTGADLVVESLVAQGVEVVFGHPGGAVLPLYDALADAGPRHVLMRHEQAAALAADGYARATGRVGVCLATSGPGATNLLTGIANAWMDSIPIVAITGQVSRDLVGTDAFQEVDALAMTMPVVKHGFAVESPEDVPWVMAEAFRLARSGRPGPVLVDLPRDVAAHRVADPAPARIPEPCAPSPPARAAVEAAAALLSAARRPLVYAGGGVVLGDLVEPFRSFIDATGLPVVTTLKGLGVLPTDHPDFLGMLGMHGLKAANLAVQECDLLVAVGVRFDDRATGKLERFAPGARVIHMDVDPAEVGKLRRPDVALVGDARPALERLSRRLQVDDWVARCRSRKADSAFRYDAPGDGVFAPRFLRDLARAAGGEDIWASDVGQHQMWLAQHGRFVDPRCHLTSGGLGTMGYGLPAGLGAAVGCPGRRVFVVTGDGSIMMNLQELATLARERLPVAVVLLDNRALGLVRQWQELFFEERYSGALLDDNPDFLELAGSFGIPAFRVRGRRDEAAAVERLAASDGPMLAWVEIDPRENVWPLVPPGASNDAMVEAPGS